MADRQVHGSQLAWKSTPGHSDDLQCAHEQEQRNSDNGDESRDVFRDFPLPGPLSPFGIPYKAYYNISDSVSNNSLDPKTRILLHLVALTVLSSATKKLPKLKGLMDVKTYIEAAVVERCRLEEIEDALSHAE